MVEHKFQWKNDGRLKIMIGCGTRPEIIRLAAVMKRYREYFDTCIVYYNPWEIRNNLDLITPGHRKHNEYCRKSAEIRHRYTEAVTAGLGSGRKRRKK